MKALRKGDTSVVRQLDRLGRSLRDLIQLTHDLQGGGIGLESLTGKIDTVSTTGKLVFHAQLDSRAHARRPQGCARARGRNGGRPKKLSPKELKTIRTLLRSN